MNIFKKKIIIIGALIYNIIVYVASPMIVEKDVSVYGEDMIYKEVIY